MTPPVLICLFWSKHLMKIHVSKYAYMQLSCMFARLHVIVTLKSQELSSSWDGTLFSTMCPGPRSTSVPSGVFIHPALSSQYTGAYRCSDNSCSDSCYSNNCHIVWQWFSFFLPCLYTICFAAITCGKQWLISNKKASIRWQDSARRQFQAVLRCIGLVNSWSRVHERWNSVPLASWTRELLITSGELELGSCTSSSRWAWLRGMTSCNSRQIGYRNAKITSISV